MEGQVQQEQPQLSPMQMAMQAATAMLQQEEGGAPQETPPEAAPEAPQEEAKEEPKAELEAPAKPTWKLKHDGQEIEKSEDEVRDLAQQGFDYTQKMQRLAKDRDAAKAEAQKAVEEAQKGYAEKLAEADQLLWESLEPDLKNTDWNKLAAENPAEWARRFQSVQNNQARLQKLRAERQRLADEGLKKQQEAIQKQIAEAQEILPKKIEGWNNDKYQSILKAGQKFYGFTAQEVGAITDPRAIEVLNDAMQWREAKAKPVTEKRVAEKPKAVMKPGQGVPDSPAPESKAAQDRVAQFRKTGSRADAVGVIADMLNSGRL